MRLFRSKKFEVGSPKRVLMRPGDVVITHQRLPKAMGCNLTNNVGKSIYYRVVHTQMDNFLDAFVKSPTPWVGFAGLQELLPQGITSWPDNVQDGPRKKTAMQRLLTASSVVKSSRSVTLTEEQLISFVKDGYVVVQGAVSKDLVCQALKFLDSAIEKNRYANNGKPIMGSEKKMPEFKKPVKRSSKVKDMFYQSGLIQACEQLLQAGSLVIFDSMCDVSYLSQSEIFVKEGTGKDSFSQIKGKVLDHKTINQTQGAGNYNVMVGVAMSEGQEVDENRGQFLVWPGTLLLEQNNIFLFVIDAL